MTTPWFRELRQLHDKNFHEDWTSHIDALNRELGLTGPDALALPAPGLAPPWFVGDVEAVPPRQWVLVISLNQARREEDEEWHLAQGYPEQTYWDHWRWFNRDEHWNPRFYRPFVRLAAQAMGVEMRPEMEQEFATTRMVFVELCPYPSRSFGLSDAEEAVAPGGSRRLCRTSRAAPGLSVPPHASDSQLLLRDRAARRNGP